MGVLMIFHIINFKRGSSILSSKDEPYASIMPGEYHFFPDSEVDAYSLADVSSYEVQDSIRANKEEVNYNIHGN